MLSDGLDIASHAGLNRPIRPGASAARCPPGAKVPWLPPSKARFTGLGAIYSVEISPIHGTLRRQPEALASGDERKLTAAALMPSEAARFAAS